MMHLSHPFLPVVDAECRILILGSFPSVKSREDGFFYGHPQNRFWKMLARVYQEPLPASIADKQALLLRHHIALWDVIASCDIVGSSDASIRNAVPVNIQCITEIASIDRVICNGQLAGKLYRHYLEPVLEIKAAVLPSTSPANAACSLNRLIELWRAALESE